MRLKERPAVAGRVFNIIKSNEHERISLKKEYIFAKNRVIFCKNV